MKEKRTALITGGNRGIGLEVCRQFASAGHRVILTSRNEKKGKEALEEISGEVHYIQLDVADPESVARARQEVEDRLGGLDILVNNAGINYDRWQQAEKADLEECHRTMEVNLFGPWRCSQAFLPGMRGRGYGRIVNVSSGSGALSGMGSGTPGYGISKAALNALTIKLAAGTRGTGILVNAVCPGWVRTDMGGEEAPRSVEKGAKGIVWAATLPPDGPSGGFFRDGKRIEW